eukprot:GHVS01077113.1.p1 GENE.GHVS01077113.1~~GHVS01077113.1.p1  ORF type:complete len:124 (-),score=28.08 GHVS01077113.1:440-811(-)
MHYLLSIGCLWVSVATTTRVPLKTQRHRHLFGAYHRQQQQLVVVVSCCHTTTTTSMTSPTTSCCHTTTTSMTSPTTTCCHTTTTNPWNAPSLRTRTTGGGGHRLISNITIITFANRSCCWHVV